MVIIYALCEPGTEVIRYVGKTNRRTVNERFAEHLRDKSKSKKVNWIKKCLKSGEVPNIIELDRCEDKDWEWVEEYWIYQCKAWGFKLTNTTVGNKFNSDSMEEQLFLKRNHRLCYTMNIQTKEIKQFNSIREASDSIGLDSKHGSAHYNKSGKKKRLSVKGHVIGESYEDCLNRLNEYENYNNSRGGHLIQHQFKKGETKAGLKKIYCNELKKEFDSITDAANALNLDKSCVTKVCKGVLKKTKGYSFIYS